MKNIVYYYIIVVWIIEVYYFKIKCVNSGYEYNFGGV